MAQTAQRILDRYEPLGTAGVGGFGTVQIAWDPRIQRRVAIKTIRLTEHDAFRANLPGAQAVAGSGVASNPASDRWHGVQPWNEYLEGEGYGADVEDTTPEEYHALSHLPGLDEARTAAILSDPRIVTVFDFEVRDRYAYLIMEYVEGLTLTRLLADYADFITLDMVTAVFDAMAGALTVAHKAGVLHLDIKPDNIIINKQGQVKVTDFGLATLADASGVGTTGGGTIGYMPLEQMRREHLDARTDEWSLAAVTYEMLTGENPFRVSRLDQAEAAIEEAELVLPSLCWGNVDSQIDDVVFYALDPERDGRYASVADFAEEMDKFLGDAAKGREQLALTVTDALEPIEEEEGASTDGWEGRPHLLAQGGLLSKLFGGRLASIIDVGAPALEKTDRIRERNRIDYVLEEPEYDSHGQLPDDEEEDPYRPEKRKPIAERFGTVSRNILGRLFAALGSGFTAALALSNMPFVPTAFGTGTAFMILVGALVVAALGAILPHIGALVSLALLGIAMVASGHAIVGAVFMIVVVVWWCIDGNRETPAANVAVSLPLLGAIGGGAAVPFLAGASLRPLQALSTGILVAAEALVMSTFGSMTLLGWNAFAHWGFSRMDITTALVALAQLPSTWATVGGWVAAAVAFALCRMAKNRALTVVGVAAAVTLVLIGSLAFGSPTVQLILSVILAAAACLVIFI